MRNHIQGPLGLSDEDIDQLMDPFLSIEERQSMWTSKPLGVQGRKVQNHWKSALKGPLVFGLSAGVVALIGLNAAVFSEQWRVEGLAAWIIGYLLLVAAFLELDRLGRLSIDEI